MPMFPSASSESFDLFGERVLSNVVVGTVADTIGRIEGEARTLLSSALGETAQTLRILAGLDVTSDVRIIDVGAGFGLTSAYLSSCGFDVCALEPTGIGFAEHASLGVVSKALGCRHDILTIGAEELRPDHHGQFGVIFSNNVLEHVDSVPATLAALSSVLEPDGMMVHSCPNYAIPFEPHFGIPLLPMRPERTARVLPRSVHETDLWKSLNFVRAIDVVDAADDLGLALHFRAGAIASSIERLLEDDEFRARHRALGRVANALVRTGVVEQLRKLPPTWSTPMHFLMARPTTSATIAAQWVAASDDG